MYGVMRELSRVGRAFLLLMCIGFAKASEVLQSLFITRVSACSCGDTCLCMRCISGVHKTMHPRMHLDTLE